MASAITIAEFRNRQKENKQITELLARTKYLQQQNDQMLKEIHSANDINNESLQSLTSVHGNLKENLDNIKKRYAPAPPDPEAPAANMENPKTEKLDASEFQTYINNLNKIQNELEIRSKVVETLIEDDKASQNKNLKTEEPTIYNSPNESEFNLNSFYNKFKEYISLLSNEELLALTHLILSSVIFYSLVQIMLTFFSNYIIEKFQLENRYPKSGKLLKLRNTLKNYYIKLNIFYIVISYLLILYLDISILLHLF